MNVVQKLHIRLKQFGDWRAAMRDVRVPRNNLFVWANTISKVVMVPAGCEYSWPDNAPCFRTVLHYDNNSLLTEVNSESSVCEHHECCEETDCPYYSNHCAYMKALNEFNIANLGVMVAQRSLTEPIK